jgi:hypothetical protein
MDTRLLNDRLQLIASVGVVIGLIMVAVEIRQSSEIARNETYVAIIDGWAALSVSEYETDIASVFEKSMQAPGKMTNTELFRLGAWLQSYVQIWQLQLQMNQGAAFDVQSEIRNEVYYLFGNHASRAWYTENRYWMSSNITEVVDEHIATKPVGTDADYFDRIRDRIRAGMAETE